MFSPRRLQAALPTLPRVTVHGLWTRVVALQHIAIPPGTPSGALRDPLWPGGAPIGGARFTPKGTFGSIYLASDPVTALMEVTSVFQHRYAPAFTIATPPWVLFGVDGVVTEILDLCDSRVWPLLDTSFQELTGDWAYSQAEYQKGRGQLPPTQVLGQAAYDSVVITGLKYPSAKHPTFGSCLVVFADRLVRGGPSFLQTYDPNQILKGTRP